MNHPVVSVAKEFGNEFLLSYKDYTGGAKKSISKTEKKQLINKMVYESKKMQHAK